MPALFTAEIAAADLADARQGGLRGQAVIYRTFERPAYALARRMVGCEQAAWDVMQDAFLRAFRQLHQFRGEAAFGLWLRSVVASEALMHLRAGRRWADLFVPLDLENLEAPAANLSTEDLEAALALLPAVPRAVLWLYHVEGYTHAEIAALCCKTPSFSKSQLSRAHARLREHFDLNAARAVPEKVIPLRRPYESLV